MRIWMSVSPQEAVRYLNELLELDREAMTQLFYRRVRCNAGLEQHRSCLTRSANHRRDVGMLGVLNGLFGLDEDGWGCISIVTGKTPFLGRPMIESFELVTEEHKRRELAALRGNQT